MPQQANFLEFRKGLRFKLFCIFTVMTALVTILFSAAGVINEIREQREHAAEKVRLMTQQLAVTVRLPLYAEDRATLLQLAAEIEQNPVIHAVVITTSSGKELVNIKKFHAFDASEISSETVEVRSNPIISSPEAAIADSHDPSGSLIGSVRLDWSTAELMRKARQTVLVSCALAFGFWLAVSILSYLALRQLTRSYNAMVRGVELMQGGDYAARIDVKKDDEPGRVALAINNLADSLQRRDEENKRLHEELLEAMRVEILSKEKLSLLNRSLAEEIIEREALQDQLIRTQKIESMGVLAGGIAHNFNNVLTGVLGYISYARTFLDESHKANMALENAEKASKRAAGIANQLLKFARADMPPKKPVALRGLIEESISLALIGTNVESVVDMPQSIRLAMADEGQLYQVFSNIIINAVQAMPGGGVITVRGENAVLNGGKPGNYVKLSFSDTGCGIPEADLNKIFDPYFTTKAEVGPGLGLSSVHSIISNYGGSVSVESVAGKGSTFTIHLPSFDEELKEMQIQ